MNAYVMSVMDGAPNYEQKRVAKQRRARKRDFANGATELLSLFMNMGKSQIISKKELRSNGERESAILRMARLNS